MDLFADGVSIGRHKSDDPGSPTKFVIPGNTRVVSVVAKAQKPRRGGILGSLSNGLVTNSGWKCSDGPFPGCKWMTQDFDDRMWPTAKEIVFHGPNWPTSVPGIVQGAKWIWSATGSGHLPQPIAYCRLNMSWIIVNSIVDNRYFFLWQIWTWNQVVPYFVGSAPLFRNEIIFFSL